MPPEQPFDCFVPTEQSTVLRIVTKGDICSPPAWVRGHQAPHRLTVPVLEETTLGVRSHVWAGSDERRAGLRGILGCSGSETAGPAGSVLPRSAGLLPFEAIHSAHLGQGLHWEGVEELTPGDSQGNNRSRSAANAVGMDTEKHSTLHGKTSAFAQTRE